MPDSEPNEEKRNGSAFRLNWQVKAVLPVAFVLLNGIILFLVSTLSLQSPSGILSWGWRARVRLSSARC